MALSVAMPIPSISLSRITLRRQQRAGPWQQIPPFWRVTSLLVAPYGHQDSGLNSSNLNRQLLALRPPADSRQRKIDSPGLPTQLCTDAMSSCGTGGNRSGPRAKSPACSALATPVFRSRPVAQVLWDYVGSCIWEALSAAGCNRVHSRRQRLALCRSQTYKSVLTGAAIDGSVPGRNSP